MLKDIKIVDDSDNEIKPKNDLVAFRYKGNTEFIPYEEAKQLVRLLQGQIYCIEAKQIDGGASHSKHKEYNNC